MRDNENELLVAIETHSIERISAILNSGFDLQHKMVPLPINIPNRYLNPGKNLITTV